MLLYMRSAIKEVPVLEQLVVADDLSGAAETAATFLLRTTRIRCCSSARESDARDPPRSPPASWSSTPTAATSQPPPRGTRWPRPSRRRCDAAPRRALVKKVDSLLRGNMAAEVRALASLLGARRRRRDRPAVAGRPWSTACRWSTVGRWHETDALATPRRAPPRPVADAWPVLDRVIVPCGRARRRAARAPRWRDRSVAGPRRSATRRPTPTSTPSCAASTVLRQLPARGLGRARRRGGQAARTGPRRAATAVRHPPQRAAHVVVAVVGSAAPAIAEQVRRCSPTSVYPS